MGIESWKSLGFQERNVKLYIIWWNSLNPTYKNLTPPRPPLVRGGIFWVALLGKWGNYFDNATDKNLKKPGFEEKTRFQVSWRYRKPCMIMCFFNHGHHLITPITVQTVFGNRGGVWYIVGGPALRKALGYAMCTESWKSLGFPERNVKLYIVWWIPLNPTYKNLTPPRPPLVRGGNFLGSPFLARGGIVFDNPTYEETKMRMSGLCRLG